MYTEAVTDPKKQTVSEDFSEIKGIATIILNSNKEILIGTELNGKDENDKKSRGDISIPFETVKDFERRNLDALRLTSLIEVVTDDKIAELSSGLKEVGIIGPLPAGNGITGAVAIFNWEENPGHMPFSPSCPDEFTNLKWMSVEQILGHDNVRPYARVLVERINNGLLEGNLPTREVNLLKKFVPSRYLSARDSLHVDVK